MADHYPGESLIAVQHMPHTHYMRHTGEDWSGISNQEERKKLQNRINKRVSRQRKTAGKHQPQQAQHDTSSISPSSSSLSPTATSSSDTISSTHLSASPVSPATTIAPPPTTHTNPPYRPQSITDPHDRLLIDLLNNRPSTIPRSTFSHSTRHDIQHKRALLTTFANQALIAYTTGHPLSWHRLDLTQLNTINGLTANAGVLGFRLDWLVCEALSPFGPVAGSTLIEMGFAGERVVETMISRAPRSLKPTPKQRHTPHHPWLDLLPFVRLRDNLIDATGVVLSAEQEQRLFEDILGSSERGGGEDGGNAESEWAGLSVWGDPWEPRSWEMSCLFVERWGWLVMGCGELVESTNYWRRRRGEAALSKVGLVEEVSD